MTGSDAIAVIGYQICADPACQTLVIDAIAAKSGGFCAECCLRGVREASATVIVAHEGGRYPVRASNQRRSSANRAKEARRKANPTRMAHRKTLEHAKRAAMRRLRAHCVELYDLLLADERQKRGLDPFPLETALRPRTGPSGWETMDAVAFYHALAREENRTDGTSQPDPQP